MQIAIVDNDLAFVRSASLILQAKGHAVRGFTRPTEALEALANAPLDVLIVDLVMPDLSGTELVRELDEKGRKPAAVILVSAHTDLVPQEEVDRLGIETFLPKPVDLAALFAAVARVNEGIKPCPELRT